MKSNIVSRRGVVKGLTCCAGLPPTLAAMTLAAQAQETEPLPALAGAAMTPDEALARLREGNRRFLANDFERSVDTHQRRLEIAQGQEPFAVLVGCSDSRVSPELLFGRGLGELFIVRVAGNTVDQAAQGSIEYAIAELGVPLVVVLGHERCGAVHAAVEVVESNATFPGSINEMIAPIIPAVLRVREEEGDLLDNAVRANISRVAEGLRTSSPLIQEPLSTGNLKIVGAYYDLEDGSVEFFDD